MNLELFDVIHVQDQIRLLMVKRVFGIHIDSTPCFLVSFQNIINYFYTFMKNAENSQQNYKNNFQQKNLYHNSLFTIHNYFIIPTNYYNFVSDNILFADIYTINNKSHEFRSIKTGVF